MARYSRDPRWITLRPGLGVVIDGQAYPPGTRVFYYPATRKMLVGDKAEQAARDFEASAADEAFMTGN